MIKRLMTTVETALDQYETYNRLRVTLSDKAVPEWILSLVLLEKKLIDAVLVVNSSASYDLKVTLAEQLTPPTRTVGTLTQSRCELELTATELEYWLRFYLELYRDGVASVNHIDVEVQSKSSSEQFDVTLYAPHSREPVSVEEARRRLGLSP